MLHSVAFLMGPVPQTCTDRLQKNETGFGSGAAESPGETLLGMFLAIEATRLGAGVKVRRVLQGFCDSLFICCFTLCFSLSLSFVAEIVGACFWFG